MSSNPPVRRKGAGERIDPQAVSGVPPADKLLQQQMATAAERKARAAAEAAERRKRERSAKRSEKRKGRRGSFDLPGEIVKALQFVSAAEDVPQSGLVALALADWLEDYRAGLVNLEPLKRPTRSLRTLYTLELPEFDLPPEWGD
jgi:hypothetical protein